MEFTNHAIVVIYLDYEEITLLCKILYRTPSIFYETE